MKPFLMCCGRPARKTDPDDWKFYASETPAPLAQALLLWFSLFMLSGFLFAESPETLSKQLQTLDLQISELTKVLQMEKNNNATLLTKSRQSGEALREAYVSAERLSAINSQLNQLLEEHSNLCKEWKVAYAQTVDALLLDAQNEKSPKRKGELGKRLQAFQKQNVQLCPGSAKIGVSQEWRSIRVEPYDGPQEVRQKLELLREISREIQIHLARLDQQLQDFQKERKTKARAEEFIQESTLFTDNVTVRRGGSSAEPTTSGANGEIDKNSSGTEIITRGELYGKEQQEQFELQYQQKKKELLSQQKDLSHRIRELQTRAQQLEIR